MATPGITISQLRVEVILTYRLFLALLHHCSVTGWVLWESCGFDGPVMWVTLRLYRHYTLVSRTKAAKIQKNRLVGDRTLQPPTSSVPIHEKNKNCFGQIMGV